MPDHGERIAVLESHRELDREVLEEVLTEVKAIREEMTKYKGFLGGITFLGGCLITAITLFKEWIVSHLR